VRRASCVVRRVRDVPFALSDVRTPARDTWPRRVAGCFWKRAWSIPGSKRSMKNGDVAVSRSGVFPCASIFDEFLSWVTRRTRGFVVLLVPATLASVDDVRDATCKA